MDFGFLVILKKLGGAQAANPPLQLAPEARIVPEVTLAVEINQDLLSRMLSQDANVRQPAVQQAM